MMVRCVYASRAATALTSAVVEDILERSRVNNPANGITGILCYSGDVFIQVLEGGRGPVNRLYNRIATDPRHTQVELMAYEEIGERRFAGWSMGQVNLTRLNPALLLKYSAMPTLDPFAVSGRVSMALFDELMATASIVGQA